MCCKCCQSCLETLYWHVFEKHFCFDESIALYDVEEPETKSEKEPPPRHEEKNNNMYDNMAFYDNVAVIANRAIFSIEPIKEKVITEQPQRKLKWWENQNPPSPRKPEKPIFIITSIQEDDSSSSSANSSESLAKEDRYVPRFGKLAPARSTLAVPSVKMRKKSLHERRVSKSLTLNIDKHELPIIRQSSFPKFYLDTPEQNQADSSILLSPSTALATPIRPHSEFNFDLRSVVQIENERSMNQPPKHHDNRFSQMKEKLKPLKILRNASSISLHSYKEQKN